MELWIATGNKGKMDEYKLLLRELVDLKIFSQKDLPTFSTRPEDGKTFIENARIKAKTLNAMKSEHWVIGEDSGLEVEGLNNLPGIHSARYAGDKASDSENIAKLLKMVQLRTSMNRNAQFKCAIVGYKPNGEEFIIETAMKGTIAKAPKGTIGFGYDSVFIPEGQTQTLAELGYAFKNKSSHRAAAVSQLIQLIQQ